MVVNFLILIIGSIGGFLLLQKIPKLQKRKQDLSALKISVIIPARNEEKTLPLLLNDLKKQTINIHEIICVDDNSTDQTLAIIKSSDVKYVEVCHKPDDWTGKTWACQKGAEKATGDILIFIDADVRISKHGIYKLACEHARQGNVIAVQPYHKVRYFYEHFAFFFNIVGIAANGVAFPYSKKKIGLFGPIILMTRNDFAKIGGYYPIRKSVIEDVSLGQILYKNAIHFQLFIGDHDLSFRMYQSFAAVFWGFTKNFASGAAKTPIFILILVLFWLRSMTVYPLMILTSVFAVNYSELLFAIAMYVLTCLHLLFIINKIGSFKKSYVIIYPLFLIFFHCVFLYSLFAKFGRKKVKWKDREISLK